MIENESIQWAKLTMEPHLQELLPLYLKILLITWHFLFEGTLYL